jgi:uncharacterized membrane protein YfcA
MPGLALACVRGIGYFIGIIITGVLIFLLGVPLAETAATSLSAALAVALTIWFVTRRRASWSAEDGATT